MQVYQRLAKVPDPAFDIAWARLNRISLKDEFNSKNGVTIMIKTKGELYADKFSGIELIAEDFSNYVS